MSQFLSALEVRMLPEMSDQKWMLISPLKYYSEKLQYTVEVPENFLTDFISFGPLKGLGQRPAVVHDFLYSVKGFDRSIADDVFKEALELVGVGTIRAYFMFLAVRLVGWKYKRNVYTLDGEIVG